MWLVERQHVGAVAYGRMQRDGAIRTLIPGVALPHDVPDSPSLRRYVLQRAIPAGCQVTGVAVLWAEGYAQLPGSVDVRAPVGRHVRNWTPTIPLVFHTVGTLSSHDDSPALTGLIAAIADSLRWAAAEIAVPAVVNALTACDRLSQSDVTARMVAQLGDDPRAATLWARVEAALPAPGAVEVGA